MWGLFVTATDTGAGKTEITSGIARVWRRQGRDFAVCKPVATGALRQGDVWVAEDTLRLARAAQRDDLAAITPHVYPEPAAPPVAARAAGAILTLEMLEEAVRRQARPGRACLVEGVGGLLCPLTEDHTVADLIVRLELPVVIVTRRSLGTLNHTLLTVEAARRRNLRVVGIVVNEVAAATGLAEETNVEELRRRLDVPILAVVPHRAGGHEEEIAEIARVDWWSLAR